MPSSDLVAPMLAAAGRLPTGPGWTYEFKYDGARAVGYVTGAGVRLYSRNGNDITSQYPELQELASLLDGREAIVDGEIVALEAGDRPSFSRLQSRMHVAQPSRNLIEEIPVDYFLFDVLHLEETDLTPLPYLTRRDILTGLHLTGQHVRVPTNFVNVDGPTVLRAAELAGLEGVVAKRLASPYWPGRRSAEWVKVPLVKTQEVIPIGYRPGEGRRAGTIGSLLLGAFDQNDHLVYIGHVGTGFTDAELRRLQGQLGPLGRTTPAVADVPRLHARNARWVEPVLVGEVEFRAWTPEGRLRHASWRGLRSDRSPGSVRRTPQPIPPPPQGIVEGALETADGRWRVEAVRRSKDRFYRLVHGDNIIEGLAIATVERLLAEAGIGMADLVDAPLGSNGEVAPGAA